MTLIRYRVVGCNSLTVRKTPSKKGAVAYYLKENDLVDIVKNYSYTKDGVIWFKIQKNNKINYVSSRYLIRITPNYLKRVANNVDRIYSLIIQLGCKHKSGATSLSTLKTKKATTCGVAASIVLQEAGLLKNNKLITHSKKGNDKSTPAKAIVGYKNLNLNTCKVIKINKKYSNIDKKYKKKGIIYIYDSNIAINGGNNYIYSCNNGSSQLKNGKYIKNKMKSGYCFTSKILYAIVPND